MYVEQFRLTEHNALIRFRRPKSHTGSWAVGAVGSASALQAEGHRFESDTSTIPLRQSGYVGDFSRPRRRSGMPPTKLEQRERSVQFSAQAEVFVIMFGYAYPGSHGLSILLFS